MPDTKKLSKEFWTIFKDSFIKWNKDDPFTMAASLSFYTIFSMPAMLLLIIDITGKAFGKDAIEGKVSYEIENIVGQEGAKQIQSIIANFALTDKGVLQTLLSIAVVLFAATNIFFQLKKSLNKIWKIKDPKKTKITIVKFIINRVEFLLLILFLGVLLILSLVSHDVFKIILPYFHYDILRINQKTMLYGFDMIASFFIVFLLFILLYKILPDAKLKLKHVWTGAMLTTLIFIISKLAISFYFNRFEPASSYGKAGSIVLILLWVYYSSLLMFFGAEFTYIYVKKYFGEIEPRKFTHKAE
jgi:membrane protein